MVEKQSFDNSLTFSELATSSLLSSDLPSNKQIDRVIDEAKESLEQQEPSSQHGKRIVDDMKQVLESSQELLHSKNNDDVIQKFIQDVNTFMSTVVEKGKEELDNEALKEAQLLISNIRDTIMFLISSNEFRQIVSDVITLFQSFTGKVSQRLKESIRSDLIRDDTPLLDFSDTAQEIETVKDDITQGNISDEQKQSVKKNFGQLLRKISDNESYSRAFNNMVNILNYLQFHTANSSVFEGSDQFYELIEDSKQIIEQFCGKSDFAKFTDDLWNTVECIQNDESINSYLRELWSFTSDVLQNPEQTWNNQSFTNNLNDLLDRSFDILSADSNKYQLKFHKLFDDMWMLFNNVKNDEVNIRFHDNWETLAKHLFTDSSGKPNLYTTQESIKQLKEIVLPMIIERLQNVPLPKIEGSNDTYDYYLESMTFNGSDILPDHFHLKILSDLDIGTVDSADNEVSALIDLRVDNIRMSFDGMKFFYKRKAFPRIEDHGICNVDIAGDGLLLRARWIASSKSGQAFQFKLSSVKCKIDELNIEIIDSQHRIIDGIVSTLFKNYIKQQVAEAIVQKIRENLDPVHKKLNEFFQKQQEQQPAFTPNIQFRNKKQKNKDLKEVWNKSAVKGKFFTAIGDTSEEEEPLLHGAGQHRNEIRVAVDAFDQFDMSKDTLTQQITNRDSPGASGAIYSESILSEEDDDDEQIWSSSSGYNQQQQSQNSDEDTAWDFQWNDIPYSALNDDGEE
jgi:hypothetical protein